MKKLIKLLIFLFLLNFNTAQAATIDEIIKQHPPLSIAIQVKNIETGKIIYSHNSQKLMIPASTVKSFVAYAALEYLKPDFYFNTEILAHNNDLYLKFSGDPTLTKADLLNLIAKLPKHNYNQFFIDDSIFDQQYSANGTSIEDSRFCFAAPTSAIVVNKNCFQVTLKPAHTIGNKAILDTKHKIDNQLITKNDPTCSPNLIARPDNSYQLNGCIDINTKPINLNIAYQDPRLMLKDSLPYKHVSFKKTPITAKSLAQHKSESLVEIVNKMQKDSDNMIANNLYKTLGAHYYKTQGSFANSSKALTAILTQINLDETRIIDGAGESRYNLLASDHLIALFSQAYGKKEFTDSLPISGIDGSLLNRFVEYPELSGKILAKTGSMGGVSNLAGYIPEKNWVFAIMINGHIGLSTRHKG